jgi:hypothetical protein
MILIPIKTLDRFCLLHNKRICFKRSASGTFFTGFRDDVG